ncbi:hypothetical protein [Aquimarina brevivitae]|uniref:Uncharacterized protein n=1 Tax=Aquimarina brevivitae TaxID=323412 RepID=A0A4Q7PG43_9FLAO|nr:hypothetical protein [Aquimarina brevivitae]RZS99461.1 hypothetical protein EV197_0676 [Aquimarina brevivitae]
METQVTIGSKKSVRSLITQLLIQWIANYVNAMSRALYPMNSSDIPSTYDKYRIMFK